jgi:DNA-binding beta-propeller fold protein YncE
MSSGTVSRLTPGDPAGTTAFPAGIGGGTEGVAATPDGLEVWTASMQTGVVAGVNAETGETVARIDGLQVPYRLAATGDGTRILVSDPEAQQLVVIDRASGSITARIDISAAAAAAGLGSTTSPQGLIVSPDSRWAFVAVQGIQRIAAVDLDLLEVVGFYRAGTAPDGIAFSPRVIQR